MSIREKAWGLKHAPSLKLLWEELTGLKIPYIDLVVIWQNQKERSGTSIQLLKISKFNFKILKKVGETLVFHG